MKKIMLSFFALAAVLSAIQSQTVKSSDLETIRARVLADMMAPAVDDATVKELIATIRPDGTWPDINYEDVSVLGFEHTRHLANMQLLCRAYKKSGSAMRGKSELKKTIHLAVNHWLEKDYKSDNWHHNEIDGPSAFTTILLIMDKDLTPTQIEKASAIAGRAHKNASGARQSGDRVLIVGLEAKNALRKRDEAAFRMLVDIIEKEMKFVPTTERGMMFDYSFHHRADNANNALAYGIKFVTSFSEWAVLLNNTSFRISEPALRMMVDYYLDGTCKHMALGKYADPGARNRENSRPPSGSNYGTTRGWEVLERLVLVTDYRKDEMQEILDIRHGVRTNPTLSYAKFFWASEYFSIQRPNYFTSVRMMSKRNANTEQAYSSEGVYNHHLGDGLNYLSLTGTEYDNLAPMFDWQKLPGATILQKPALPPENEIQKRGAMEFVGAVTDGLYGAVGYDFISPHDPVRARKAWFFFDNEYVCLGADIWYQFRKDGSWTLPGPIVTTLNQCHLKGDVVVHTGGAEQTATKGERQFEEVRWVYHDRVGYLFPQPTSINLYNTAATGSWYSVSRGNDSPKDEISADVFKLWITHGPFRMVGLTYQYIVMPGADKEQVANAWLNPKVEILSNTADVQAVWHKELNICQIVAYKNGALQLPNGFQVVMDSPGIYMLNFKNNGFELSVADPQRKLGKILVSINRKIERNGDNYFAQWNEAKGLSHLSIDMPQPPYAGKSVTLIL